MAYIIRINGEKENVVPANGSDFTLDEIKTLIDCDWVEVVKLSGGMLMVIDEEGKLVNKRCNLAATELYGHPYDVIVGDVLVCDKDQVK